MDDVGGQIMPKLFYFNGTEQSYFTERLHYAALIGSPKLSI